jgi:hypothetical protein
VIPTPVIAPLLDIPDEPITGPDHGVVAGDPFAEIAK